MKKALILFLCFISLSGCTRPALVKKAKIYLGTIVEITVADQDKSIDAINSAIKKAFAEIGRVEALLSRFNPESDISKINSIAWIRPVKVSPETIALLEKSIMFSGLTDGAFDITVYPLMKLWGFVGKDKPGIPEPEQLKEALGKVGYQNINILKQEQSVFLGLEGMSLDLGGIAKGYAVDRAIAVLRQEGIRNALVNAGGDIYALGNRFDKDSLRRWRIAVQHPRKSNAILTTLEIQDKAVATSGDYQKYIEIEGRRFSHIINPDTGFPVEGVPCSVTVLAEDCLTADALATSVFILGPGRGVDLINQLKNTEVIVVGLGDGGKLDISVSRGLKKLRFNQ